MNKAKKANKFNLLFLLIFAIAASIRLYSLDMFPPALHGDELGVGYNAQTLLKTGRDEYGSVLPFVFRTDFTPLIFYATVPAVWLLSLSEWSTRLPTALVGIATVPVVYLLTSALTQNKKLSLLVMLLVTVSPWHIRASRIAMELTWGFFLPCLGTYFFLRALRGRLFYLLLAFTLFGISTIAYHATKMSAPLLLIGLIFIYRKRYFQHFSFKQIVPLSLLAVIPTILYLAIQPLINVRFIGISVITAWKSMPGIKDNVFSIPSLTTLLTMITSNYVSHFSPILLFFSGSNLRYHFLEFFGLFYHWEIITIIIGLYALSRNNNKPTGSLLLFWFILAPLPAALTTGVPYSNIGRVMMMLFPLVVLSASGVIKIFTWFKSLSLFKRIPVLIVATLTLSLSVYFLFLDYFVNSPQKFVQLWGIPYKLAAKIVLSSESELDKVVFSSTNPQSYMYVLFYGKKSPEWLFAQERTRSTLIGYNKIGKFEFRPIDWSKERVMPKSLYVGTPQEIPTILPQRTVTVLKDDTLRIVRVD